MFCLSLYSSLSLVVVWQVVACQKCDRLLSVIMWLVDVVWYVVISNYVAGCCWSLCGKSLFVIMWQVVVIVWKVVCHCVAGCYFL